VIQTRLKVELSRPRQKL